MSKKKAWHERVSHVSNIGPLCELAERARRARCHAVANLATALVLAVAFRDGLAGELHRWEFDVLIDKEGFNLAAFSKNILVFHRKAERGGTEGRGCIPIRFLRDPVCHTLRDVARLYHPPAVAGEEDAEAPVSFSADELWAELFQKASKAELKAALDGCLKDYNNLTRAELVQASAAISAE